jgi:hypothetical protein
MGISRGIGAVRCAALVVLICGCTGAGARAAETVKLTASFQPNLRGARTTILFGFTVGTTDGSVPAGLSGIDLHLPSHMGLATTSLGLATCEAPTLIAAGLNGCSTNARIGYGSAVVEVPLGPQLVVEHTGISALLAPDEDSHQRMLFYANGITPVFAQLVFPAKLLPESGSVGGGINTTVPVVGVLPDGPNASVVKFSSTIGPLHLTYYKRRHGKRVAFRPRGVKVPKACPRGGYPFSADFEFQDATVLSARTHVPCPTR